MVFFHCLWMCIIVKYKNLCNRIWMENAGLQKVSGSDSYCKSLRDYEKDLNWNLPEGRMACWNLMGREIFLEDSSLHMSERWLPMGRVQWHYKIEDFGIMHSFLQTEQRFVCLCFLQRMTTKCQAAFHEAFKTAFGGFVHSKVVVCAQGDVKSHVDMNKMAPVK